MNRVRVVIKCQCGARSAGRVRIGSERPSVLVEMGDRAPVAVENESRLMHVEGWIRSFQMEHAECAAEAK